MNRRAQTAASHYVLSSLSILMIYFYIGILGGCAIQYFIRQHPIDNTAKMLVIAMPIIAHSSRRSWYKIYERENRKGE